MAAKEIAGRKYVVKLSAEERDRLDALIHKGKHSAQLLMKARILLKADVSEGGQGWSDSRIARALDTISRRSAGPVSNWLKKASTPFLRASIRQPRPGRACSMVPRRPS